MCPIVAWKTKFGNFVRRRSLLTIRHFQPSWWNCVLRCRNTSIGSEHWPFGNWPGKGPVETKPENEQAERLRELTARIATEQDHDKFTSLVEELNRILDGENGKQHKSADA